MLTDSIEFQGKFYAVRIIDFGQEWGLFIVASEQLLELLLNCDYSYTSTEARYVDESIFYFIPVHYFRLSDSDLRDKILSQV